ncbi:MAG TPA: rhodanese-like domain-containing protein [Candidatus Dormibacteraeota bacterium]|nr:rhodanese-like domain-containing protein [Candidatus Dormibacteraeota bacterium]
MKATIAAVAVLFAVSFSASALRAQQNDAGPTDPAMAMAESAPVPTVTPADVLKLMQQQDANVVLVDTQPASGFADTHIPGAVNYPWVMRIAKFPISLPRDKTLIFYGSCPNDTSDTIKQLAEYGYFNVKVMDGGLYKWESLKYPVVRGAGNDAQHPDLSQATPSSIHRGN